MNEYQKTLYSDLIKLVESNDAFYFQDFEKHGNHYRIFNYRLASYTDFLEPNALECRGHMFQIDPETNEMLRLASLPPEKFFNLYENPFTMDLDLTSVDLIEDKADGSLISTFINPGETGMYEPDVVHLKTKGSLESDQAIAAAKWLSVQSNLKAELTHLSVLGYTVNMEWVAPDNRIVLGYEKPELRVLNIRNMIDGSYLDRNEIHGTYSTVYAHWVDRVEVADPISFVDSIADMKNIEGYVIRLNGSQRIKVKTNWYLTRHHTKDSINSPRRLFECVLEEASDDLKTMFHEDKVAMRQIEEMEQFVEKKYNSMIDMVETYYEENKHKDRKTYAIEGQEHFTGENKMFFSLAMSKYVGKKVNYKEFLKSKWKQLGLRDELENENG